MRPSSSKIGVIRFHSFFAAMPRCFGGVGISTLGFTPSARLSERFPGLPAISFKFVGLGSGPRVPVIKTPTPLPLGDTPPFKTCARKNQGKASVWSASTLRISPPYPCAYAYLPKPPSCVAVLMSWHRLHSGCQLSESQNKSLLPLCGMMWSTTDDGTSSPCS